MGRVLEGPPAVGAGRARDQKATGLEDPVGLVHELDHSIPRQMLHKVEGPDATHGAGWKDRQDFQYVPAVPFWPSV